MSDEVYRILDANFNRAREAIRVLEDFVRFVLNDSQTAIELKDIRQKIGKLSILFGNKLIASRDSVYDVGKKLDEHIKKRRTQEGLIMANFKRLEEALRSIEEYSRIFNIAVSNESQRLRFRAYTIEKNLSALLYKRHRLNSAKLYVLLDKASTTKPLEWVARESLLGGADILQLRGDFIDKKLLRIAKNIKDLTQEHNAIFIINNRVDIAKAVDADGVHLGRHDLPVAEARSILQSHKIIGATTHNLSEVHRAMKDGADYISVGPMFASQTKTDILPNGFSYVKQTKRLAGNISIFCIGGIDITNVKSVLKYGLNKMAVCKGIISQDNIRVATKRLKSALKGK